MFYTGDPLALRMNIQPTGDISFYEDTGTTAKFFWDASAESLGIGTSSPSTSLDVVRAGVQPLRVQSTSGTEVSINMVNTGGNVQLEAHNGNFNIDADAVGIGTSSPNALLHVGGTAETQGSQTNPAIQIGSTTGYRLGMYTDAERRIHRKQEW